MMGLYDDEDGKLSNDDGDVSTDCLLGLSDLLLDLDTRGGATDEA